jgi:hypothetical protein
MSVHSSFKQRSLRQTARAIALALAWLAAASPLSAQSPDLPAGPAQEKVRTACTECHDSRIILQQRLSKPSWTKEVDKMIRWGAVVDATDRSAFIDYLSINFPPDKAPDPAERAASVSKK